VYLYELTLGIIRASRPLMSRARIHGEEILKRTGPLVVASNHIGWMEILFVAYAFYPRRVRFMAKRELFAHPAAGWALRGLGAFPINREHPAASEWKQAIRLLREGNIVCLLAAGTRGGTETKEGAARLALASGAPLVTARYDGPPAPHPRFLLTRPEISLWLDVVPLEPVDRKSRSTRSHSKEITKRVDESIHSQQ
jgi:1-acyl-sn-glycerol-3-phosphate acyltransferase